MGSQGFDYDVIAEEGVCCQVWGPGGYGESLWHQLKYEKSWVFVAYHLFAE